MRQKQRDNVVDISRFLGIFFIIWGHTYCPWTIIIYSFHIPLFFILSGIYHKEKTDFFVFLKKKANRIVIPYLFFSLASYLFYMLWYAVFLGIDKFDFLNILNIFAVKNTVSEPLWFFVSLFEVALIYFFLRKSISSNLVLGFCLFIFCLIGYLLSPVRFPYWINYFHIASSVSMLLFYGFGNLVLKPYRKQITTNSYAINLLILISLFTILLLASRHIRGIDVNTNRYDMNLVVYLVAALAGSISVVIFAWFIAKVPFLSKTCAHIGQNSLGIFGLHFPVFELSRPVSTIILPKDSTSWGILVAVNCLLLSWLATEIIKRIFPKGLGLSTNRE